VRTAPKKDGAKKNFKNRVQEKWNGLKDETTFLKTTKAFRTALAEEWGLVTWTKNERKGIKKQRRQDIGEKGLGGK
jgi:hypothetical protein